MNVNVINNFVLKKIKPKSVRYHYSWVGHIPFAYIVIDILRPRLLVELGTHKGNSFNTFCQSVKENNLATQCVAIDAWQGDLHMGEFPESIYTDLKAYVETHYSDFARLDRRFFDDAVDDYADGSIDLLHIDGLHTYDAVKNDFETWLPKLSDSAVVLFHDTTVVQEHFGVLQYWSEISTQYPSFNFDFSHGLGVLLVGEKVPPEFVEFVAFANAHAKFVNNFFYNMAEECLPSEAFQYIANLKSQEMGQTFSPAFIDALRDGAVALESKNLAQSLLLMRFANQLRPDGPFIKQKYDEYARLLQKA